MDDDASRYLRQILTTPITYGLSRHPQQQRQEEQAQQVDRLLSRAQRERAQQAAILQTLSRRNKKLPVRQDGPIVKGKPACRVNMHAFRNLDQFTREQSRMKLATKKSSLRSALEFKDDASNPLRGLPRQQPSRKICTDFFNTQVCMNPYCQRLHAWNPDPDRDEMPIGDDPICFYNLLGQEMKCKRKVGEPGHNYLHARDWYFYEPYSPQSQRHGASASGGGFR